jgi:hypothetical protein
MYLPINHYFKNITPEIRGERVASVCRKNSAAKIFLPQA